MQAVLLKQVQIFDKQSPYHLQKADILIENGYIGQIAEHINAPNALLVEQPNLSVSPGWFDLRAFSGDPGTEHREDLQSLAQAALKGGFTDVLLLPNTQPVVQTRAAVRYVIHQSANLPVCLHPSAALTKNTAGGEMTELLDLKTAGALAFTDGLLSMQNSGLLLNCLRYLSMFDGLLMHFAQDSYLAHEGQMHEGETAVTLGLKGIPTLAETIAIEKALAILRYTGGKIHFSTISAAESVALIARAKAEGLRVTCDVAAYQLYFNDEALTDFDTNLKVSPPLRSENHRQALWQGLANGTIDAVVSNHLPHDTEAKELEFDLADCGMTALETAFAAGNMRKPTDFPLALFIEKISNAPRQLLGISPVQIATGQQAHLTLFNAEEDYTVSRAHFASKSLNSPFVGHTLKGRAWGIFAKGQLHQA